LFLIREVERNYWSKGVLREIKKPVACEKGQKGEDMGLRDFMTCWSQKEKKTAERGKWNKFVNKGETGGRVMYKQPVL